MQEVSEDELPVYLKHNFLKQKIDIMVQSVKDAGMEKEFLEFMESPEINDVIDVEDVFIKFGKKYPDKFYIVPEGERMDKIYYCSLGRERIHE